MATLVILAGLSASMPALAMPARAAFTGAERETARYHLQNLFNELDLLLRNRSSNHADLLRQEKEMDDLKVYERIPFKRDVAGLRQALARSAAGNNLTLVEFHALPETPRRERAPRAILTDNRSFRISESWIAANVPFQVEVRGDAGSVERWSAAWPDLLPRLAKRISGPARSAGNTWSLQGTAYRFRRTRYPRLILRDPLSLVPSRERGLLATAEPGLWNLVQAIRHLSRLPEVPGLYAERGQFLLEGARMEFFLRRVLPKT